MAIDSKTRSLPCLGSLALCFIGAFYVTAQSSLAQETIQHLPAIDLTDLGELEDETLRLGRRMRVDPFPATGSQDWSDQQVPRLQRPYEELQPVDPNQWWTPPPDKLPAYKDGFFQKLWFSATWLDGGRAGDLGITEVEALLTVALPLPSKDHPLLITPAFETRYLNGPLAPDLPARLYSA